MQISIDNNHVTSPFRVQVMPSYSKMYLLMTKLSCLTVVVLESGDCLTQLVKGLNRIKRLTFPLVGGNSFCPTGWSWDTSSFLPLESNETWVLIFF